MAQEPHHDNGSSLKKLHQEAFWVFGVIVGLAITETLTKTLEPLFSGPSAEGSGGPAPPPLLAIARLLVFLIVVCRFYLGAVVFFNRGRTKETDPFWPFPKSSAKPRGQEFDFIAGFCHFILFFVWGITAPVGKLILFSKVSPYLFFMTVVIGWDGLWWILTELRKLFRKWFRHEKGHADGDTAETYIKTWALRNIRTILWYGIPGAVLLWRGHWIGAESFALAFVFVVSIKDFREMIRQQPPKLWKFGLP